MHTTLRAVAALCAAGLATSLLAPPSQARPIWDTTAVHVTRDVRPMPKVVDLRVGEHRRFDRVVIDLAGKLPGYHVRYVRALRYDGSGQRVDLNGRRFIQIRLFPAKAHNRFGRSVYDGPTLQQYRMPTLRGVALIGDFEGQVTFGLSLRRRADFRVFVLRQPNRIIVDLRH